LSRIIQAPNNNINANIGENVYDLRTQDNMSQADPAQTTNMSINQDNPFQLAKNVNSEVYGRKSTCGKEVTSKVLVPSALQRKSNSYFPQTQNRLSSLSNQLSEISEVVEDKNSQTVNISFDANIGFQMPVAQRYSLQNTISPSFTVEESEELKVPYNSRKIFVGGLPHGITEPEFTQYFSQYGEIED
jgi:hypothetical protein